ncbi:MAG: hypothetical protein AB7S78_08970 [Candidatus Omnitrophota bacterium]
MPRKIHALFLIVSLGSVLYISGCAKKETVVEAPTTPAHTKLSELLEKEFKIHAITRALPNTLWIYIPLEKTFFEVSSTDKGPQKSSNATKSLNLLYLDGQFDGKYFNIEYDVGESKNYSDDKGIQSKYSEEYSRISRTIPTAIHTAYSDIERKVGSHDYIEKIAGDIDFQDEHKNTTHKALVQSNVLQEQKVPDFFVVVIADIEKGIESRSLFYLQDLRRAHVDPNFMEEYAKRVITDQPIGHSVIIGDKTGQYVDYHDVTWNEFLMKQILNRIRFQYQMSSHKPESGDFDILKDLANQVLRAYPHRDYQGVNFLNLETKKESRLNADAIDAYQDFDSKDPGRIRNIKVNLDAPAENGI